MTTQLDPNNVQRLLCSALCADVVCTETTVGLRVDTPFRFPDGDGYSIFLQSLPAGGVRLSDKGSTLMHLSYEQDVSKLEEGTRQRVFDQILTESGIANDGGELFVEGPVGALGDIVFRFGQALTRVHDLTFLNRIQVESTFYDDLHASLLDIVGDDRLMVDFEPVGVPDAEAYLADFAVDGTTPLLIFGVPNKTKATLSALVITYLQKHRYRFHSLAVYDDMTTIPRRDVARLTNAADAQIASVSDREALRRKITEGLR